MFKFATSSSLYSDQHDESVSQLPPKLQDGRSPTDKSLNILHIAIRYINNSIVEIASSQERNSSVSSNERLEELKTILGNRVLAAEKLKAVNLEDIRIQTAMTEITALFQKIDSLKTQSPAPVDATPPEGQHKIIDTVTIPLLSTTLPERPIAPPYIPLLKLPLNKEETQSGTANIDFFELNYNLQLIAYIIEGLIILSIIGVLLMSGIIFAPGVVAFSTGIATLATTDILFSATSAAYQFFTRPEEHSIPSPNNLNTPDF